MCDVAVVKVAGKFPNEIHEKLWKFIVFNATLEGTHIEFSAVRGD